MYLTQNVRLHQAFTLTAIAAGVLISASAVAQNGSPSFQSMAIQAERVKAERRDANPKAARIEDMYRGKHQQRKKLDASERKPSVPVSVNAKQKYGEGEEKATSEKLKSKALERPSKVLSERNSSKGVAGVTANAALAACDLGLFANSSGAALVTAVKSSTSDCINSLFSVSGGNAGAIFSESKMVTIADAFRNAAAAYNGTNSGSTLQMVMFLRAGYYVNYYDEASTGAYGSALKSSIRAALDAFVNNGNFGLVNDAHGETLSEFVTLIDSASENARYLNSVVKRLLTSYNSNHVNYWWMMSATNNVFTILFRGHQNADFKTLVQSDTTIIDTLYNFANTNFNLLGTDNGYLISNAGRELGRFLQYADNTPIKILARARAKALIDQSSITGKTAALWVGVGEQVDYYDQKNCSYYNMCDFSTRLATNVLPISHSCSPTLRLRAQAMTSTQLAESCTTLVGQESYFHSKVASGKIPVANDNNTQLEMVVFSSSQDYGTYAGAIYGIDTNNGGMYLEGSPEVAGNQARFIAYQAEWMLPKFEIWNLTHEYVHYLDGRFNMYGDFGAAMGVSSVWWIEGFAEYMSYGYRNLAYDGAKTQAAAGTYNLSTIFSNDYNSGQTRVYNWGYLAVRYMFEKQRPKVSNVLGYFRPGNYSGYTTYMKSASMASSMDADFKNWLPCVNNASLPQCTGSNANVAPTANFTASVSGLTAQFSNASSDSDGTIASSSWNFGDGTTSTATSPSKTYTTAGTYTVTLTVTDNLGLKSTVKSSTVTVGGTASNVAPNANFTFAVNGLTAAFTNSSTDSDGTIAAHSWSFGDGTTSTLANPSKTYSVAGTYSVALTVTDNKGAKSTAKTSSVTVTSGGGTVTECPGGAQQLGNNCVRTGISATAGNYAYMYVLIPAGTRQVTVSSSGGTGNADLYVSTLGQWATRNYYNYGSFNSGNNESVVVSNPPSGYMYISLYGQAAFSGAQVKVQF
jgi:microbial collagenase